METDIEQDSTPICLSPWEVSLSTALQDGTTYTGLEAQAIQMEVIR